MTSLANACTPSLLLLSALRELRALGFGFLVTGSVSDPEDEVHVTDVTSVHLCLMKHLCLMLRLRYMCVAS